jgi:hypothetical protein
MKSPPKLETLSQLAKAEWRNLLEREAREDLRRFRREEVLSVKDLAVRFGCSADSIERYLLGERPVPGYIVLAIRAGKAAA